ncbi:Ribosomal large subunit pseudouridine synthase B [Candidatus Gromoviella agglomerans]|nr:Ribosomal large subunit pseudouridine synthase B [Candidatus Gromoviella agglomerans]
MGICSRRDAEKLIALGKVKINNKVISSPVHFVLESDVISVNEGEISTITPKMWIYYKPTMVITSHKDERKTVFKEVKKYIKEHVISIGRLDYMSEGLLILTNSPQIAHFMENPRNKIPRTYMVLLNKSINKYEISQIQNGLKIDKMEYKPCILNYQNSFQQHEGHWIKITLYEGKNREIRRIFSYMKCKILKLIRISYGDISLDEIKPGNVMQIKQSIVNNLLTISKPKTDK